MFCCEEAGSEGVVCIRGDARAQVVKIGEGTFGEAFKGNGMVLKIVPMGNQHLKVIA